MTRDDTHRQDCLQPTHPAVNDQSVTLRSGGDPDDVGPPGVLIAIADRCGLEGRALLDAADTETVRTEYQGNTVRALAAGIFGSPFYSFAGELFWGQDRLDMLEEAIVRSTTAYSLTPYYHVPGFVQLPRRGLGRGPG